MGNINKSDALCKIVQSFVSTLEKKTSWDFSIKSVDFFLSSFKNKYIFIEYISIDSRTSDKLLIKIEDTIEIQNSSINHLSIFLEDFCVEIFKSILQNESYYTLDLNEIANIVTEEVGFLFDEFGFKIRWRTVIQGAFSSVKGGGSGGTSDIKLKEILTKSDILNPLINTMIDLVYEGLLEKGKNRESAIKVITNSMRELEKEHEIFKLMLIDEYSVDKTKYDIRTEWKVENYQLSDNDESYTVDVVSKIDLIDNDIYAQSLKDFIVKVGTHINVQDRPYFIPRLINLLDKNIKNKFLELNIDTEELEKIFRKIGYNEVVEKILEVLIELIGSKTSINFAVTAVYTIIEQLKNRDESVLRHITVDTALYENGIEAFIINPDINNEAPSDIARTLTHILKMIQDNRDNHQDKVNFIQDFKRELGERYILEMENLGVNVNIISLRYS